MGEGGAEEGDVRVHVNKGTLAGPKATGTWMLMKLVVERGQAPGCVTVAERRHHGPVPLIAEPTAAKRGPGWALEDAGLVV